MKAPSPRIFISATFFGFASIGGLVPPAAASTGSTSMEVSLHVKPNCRVAAEPLAFGSVSSAETPGLQAASSIEVTCTEAVPFSVSMDEGMNASGGSRRAVDPAIGMYVAYEIYADPANMRRWGQLPPETVTATATSAGWTRLPAYGRIVQASGAAAGDYRDVVTVMVDF